MRRLLQTIVGLTVGMMLVAPSATAQAPAQDSVTGSGSAWDPPPIVGILFAFEIDARSGPRGENPTGQVTVRMQVPLTGAIFSGPVTCLAVNGTRAILNFQDNGGIVTLEVADSPTGDTIELLPSARQPADCSPLSPSSIVAEVFAGDLVVVDAPPLPTSKDECKSGGWRNYPGFVNQGDCMAFVATRGKNPPA